jgi:hypothetical protein
MSDVTFKIKEQSPLTMTIIAMGSSREALVTKAVRDAVLVEARKQGFPASGTGIVPNPYAVDAKGETPQDLLQRPAAIHHWEAEYQANAPIR